MVSLSVLFVLILLSASASRPAEAFWKTKSEEEVVLDNEPVVHHVDDPVEYGVDVSFPIQHSTVPKSGPLGNRQAVYDEYLNGCVEKFGSKGAARCRSSEHDRVAMSLRQPQSMQNYTDIGFKKIKAPETLWKLIKEFWDRNKDKQTQENWGIGNTYTNNWVAPTYMVSVEDQKLRGGGYALKQRLWNEARNTIQEWTGQELTQCSLYGVRIYKEGAMLATHVDRLPLVSSAIINVDQDLDEPWPLEVYGHDGKAYNVTMEPGDMVLYESHSVLHGRPFALKGRFMANIFVHFEPVGHSLRHNANIEHGDVHKKYRDALDRGQGGHENDNNGLPPYLIPGTPEEPNWRRSHPNGFKPQAASFGTGSLEVHSKAQAGDLKGLQEAIKQKKDLLHAKDKNGWQPLHEASRGGHVDVVKWLVESGADPNATTSNGGTALYWAKFYDPSGEVVEFLESIGALDEGPEL